MAQRDRIGHKRGASAQSYGLVIGLISVVALTAVTTTGGSVNALFSDVGGTLNDVVVENVNNPSPAVSASASPPPCTPGSQSYGSFTGVDESLTIPPGCGTVTITAVGGMGGDGTYDGTDNGGPGRGGTVQVTFSGNSVGELLIRVGEGGYGGCRNANSNCTSLAGGRLGRGGRSGAAGITGGDGGINTSGHYGGGGGGGYSSVTRVSDGQLLVVAGAGGGGAAENDPDGFGGGGGGLTANNGQGESGSVAQAGNQSTGGAGGTAPSMISGESGGFLTGGNAGSISTSSTNCMGGGGGAGYYGGGGGASLGSGGGCADSGGGAGGSSFIFAGDGDITPSITQNAIGANGVAGENNGNKGTDGSVSISWSD